MQHGDIWRGIDLLAEKHGLSASGLARLAGLDATAFNKSKRVSVDGRLRWPSTESLSRALDAVGDAYRDFVDLVDDADVLTMPLLEFAEASAEQHFDAAGRPLGSGWETVEFPDIAIQDGAYILEVTDRALTPVFRPGDRLVISPGAGLRQGDRVIAKTRQGAIEAFQLGRQTKERVTLKSLDTQQVARIAAPSDFAWIARILWVSQ